MNQLLHKTQKLAPSAWNSTNKAHLHTSAALSTQASTPRYNSAGGVGLG